MAHALFITGTDTGVGKTWVAAGLIRSLRARGIRAVGFKPILCGEDRTDAEILRDASRFSADDPPDLSLDEVNPVWFRRPVAPLAVPLLGETTPLDRCAILDTWESLATRFEFVVIEGAGGWEVPLTETATFAELAKAFAAPVLVVAANRLGVLNHTKLTVDAIIRDGLDCAGIVLNEVTPKDAADVARMTNLSVLRQMFRGLPVVQVEWNHLDFDSGSKLYNILSK